MFNHQNRRLLWLCRTLSMPVDDSSQIQRCVGLRLEFRRQCPPPLRRQSCAFAGYAVTPITSKAIRSLYLCRANAYIGPPDQNPLETSRTPAPMNNSCQISARYTQRTNIVPSKDQGRRQLRKALKIGRQRLALMSGSSAAIRKTCGFKTRP